MVSCNLQITRHISNKFIYSYLGEANICLIHLLVSVRAPL